MTEKKLPARPGINTVKKMRERLAYLEAKNAEVESAFAQNELLVLDLHRQRNETMALLRKREAQGQEIRDALSPAYAELPLEEAVVANLDEIATRAMNATTRAQEAEAQLKAIKDVLDPEFAKFVDNGEDTIEEAVDSNINYFKFDHDGLDIVRDSRDRWRKSFHILAWLFLIAVPVFMITGYECAVHFGGHTLPQGGK